MENNKNYEFGHIWSTRCWKRNSIKFNFKKFNLYQLSTGELLRKEIKNKTKLGNKISSIINSGDLVSDKIVSELIENFISKKEVPK